MVLKILRRVGEWTAGRARHLTAQLLDRPGDIEWARLCDGGVLIAPAPGIRPDDLRITVRFDDGAELQLPIGHVDRLDGRDFVFAPLPPNLIGSASRCALTVAGPRHAFRLKITLGPCLYSGRLEGVRDYALEGWVAPLFEGSAGPVRLLVDRCPGEPVRLHRFRPELARAGRQGGWNGFRLPLPAQAVDGKPHHLAVEAGGTVLDFGNWQAKPRFHIDSTVPDQFAGWYFDPSIVDAPTTMRIERDGVTCAVAETHFRPDLKDAFGRTFASFHFVGQRIEPGSLLIAGPDGAGVVVGHLAGDLIARVAVRRDAARDLLLGSSGPDAAIDARRAIRVAIIETERAKPEPLLRFTPGSVPRDGRMRTTASNRPSAPPPVCAIVPVYNGLADLKVCIESLLPQLSPGRIRAVMIDDCSPAPGIRTYLAELSARGHPGLTVLSNEANLGFIATVNRGFSLLAPGEDALIVNADTILPPGAVEKLAAHCHVRPGVASVTPMSNNATILSFPSMTRRNSAAFGLDVAALDRAFADEAAEPVVIPTGIGFCMHLNRKALDEVGPFATEWGRGYCEEVDWCLTARDLGWMHLAATDTFVMHEGSVSFGAEERLAILAVNHARLERRYPEYLGEVSAVVRADPFEDLRIAVLTRLFTGRFRHLVLHLTHGLGGGTKRYIDDLVALPRSPDTEVAILQPSDDAVGTRLLLSFNGSNTVMELNADRLQSVLAAIEASGTRILVHVNSRLSYDGAFLKSFLSSVRPYVVMLHDFQWYCPRVQLTDGRNFYCGEPPPSVCQHCISCGTDYSYGDQDDLVRDDVAAWLAFNTGLLRGAARLLAPSSDTADRYLKRFGIADIATVPHIEGYRPVPARTRARRNPGSSGVLRIAVVGAISAPKGFDLLVAMAAFAESERLPFFLTVIGSTCGDPQLLLHGNVRLTGRYAPSELGAHLAEADPDFVFFPSVWPETFSYVLTEVWDAGYPVVAFDIGAPAERIRAQGGGLLIEPTRDARALLDTLRRVRDKVGEIVVPRGHRAEPATLEDYYRECGIDLRELDGRTSAVPAEAPVLVPAVLTYPPLAVGSQTSAQLR